MQGDIAPRRANGAEEQGCDLMRECREGRKALNEYFFHDLGWKLVDRTKFVSDRNVIHGVEVLFV